MAISLQRNAPWPALRLAGWAYAAGTSVVIVGTGNHWVIDVVVGWLVVLVGFAVAAGSRGPDAAQVERGRESTPPALEPSRERARAATWRWCRHDGWALASGTNGRPPTCVNKDGGV